MHGIIFRLPFQSTFEKVNTYLINCTPHYHTQETMYTNKKFQMQNV